MRITFLSASADMSGGSRVMHIYATHLQARGHQVTVVVPPPKPLTLRDRIKAIVRGRPGSFARSTKTHYRSDTYVFKVLGQYRPILPSDVPDSDVVIASWWETAEWMANMPPSKGKHVHFVQGYESYDHQPKDRVDAVLSTPIFKITISKWLDALLKDQFANRYVAMVPNSVDMDQFHAPRRSRQLQPTIGMLYSDTKWKDCRTGLDAFKIFQEKFPGARLVTFGQSEQLPELPLPPGTLHTRLPDQDKIRDLYAKCDVWFCSSTHEGFHLPPLEAMACRCPVISTPVGGPLDTIVEGVNGFFIPIGDAAQMALTLDKFFALSEEQWQSMSDAAYTTAIGYSWNDAAIRFEQALDDAAARA